MEIPEVDKENVKITAENGALTIKGERKQEKEGKKIHRIECTYGCFARSFALPENIDETQIEATFKDGMLNIRLPKTAVRKPKAVDIKINCHYSARCRGVCAYLNSYNQPTSLNDACRFDRASQ